MTATTRSRSETATHPIDTVQWIPIEAIRENTYNPNSQLASTTLMLIESIQDFGWTLPIVVRPPDTSGVYVVIDGAHRLQAARALNYAEVPVVILDIDRAGCISATVKHNRARGQHSIESTLDLIHALRDTGQLELTPRGRIKQAAF